MAYTEDALVEQPAIQLFEDLEWETVNCFDERFGTLSSGQQPLNDSKAWLGRENRAEIVLVQRLRSALAKLNPNCSLADINSAIEALSRDRSSMSPIAANASCLLNRNYLGMQNNVENTLSILFGKPCGLCE